MKNFIQHGDSLELAAPYDVASGAGALIGAAIFGVAVTTVASGAVGVFALEGVFDLKAKTTDTAAVGAKAYWDDTNKEITTTATSNKLVGAFTAAKASGDVVGRVLLDGAVR